jgi:hypothetical protein
VAGTAKAKHRKPELSTRLPPIRRLFHLDPFPYDAANRVQPEQKRMNENWRAFLASRPPATGFPPAAVCDLSHLGLIRARGEDAAAFLQGQLTNDTRLLGPERAQLTATCSPKGRMLATLLAFVRDGDLYLQLPAERLEGVLKRLRLFVLRAKVTLGDASDELARLGLAGDFAADVVGGALPPQPFGVAQRHGLTLVRLPGDPLRVEAIGPVDEVTALWREAEAAGAAVAGADWWALLDIRAGVPTVLDATVEAFVPQMANLQLVDGVSFTKGCYTGQEVVARMQYLGKLKRRMRYARVASPARPGDELWAPGSESGQGAGKVVDARPSPGGGSELLAVVETASAAAGGVRLGGPDGPVLEFGPLPYALPDEG